ncbi:MAG: methyltransferase [Treponema sp.]|nr:methyltransferase [Treponema sp.]
MIFYAAFVPGLQECVAEAVKDRLPDAVIQKLLDGAIIFQTGCTYDKLNFFCFNNIFLVSDILDGEFSPETHMKKIIAAHKNDPVISCNNKKIQSFRIICSMENKFVPVNEKIKQDTERFIAMQSGMTVNRSLPDTEFWFLYRNETGKPGETSFSIFMKRLTKHASWEKSLRPGELPPPLAWMLCRLAGLKHSDTAADPFCGSGAIPLAALKHFPVKKFIACDNDPKAIARTKNALQNCSKEKYDVYKTDIRSILSILEKDSIDAIITDPPWGMYKETEIPIELFYDEMMKIFKGLLKEDGIIVLLTAKVPELQNAVKETELAVKQVIPILLSGKKTSIFIIKKEE